MSSAADMERIVQTALEIFEEPVLSDYFVAYARARGVNAEELRERCARERARNLAEQVMLTQSIGRLTLLSAQQLNDIAYAAARRYRVSDDAAHALAQSISERYEARQPKAHP